MAECRRLFPNQQLVVLWLGSSIGNLSSAEAVQFFRDMTASAGTNIQVCAELRHPRSVVKRQATAMMAWRCEPLAVSSGLSQTVHFMCPPCLCGRTDIMLMLRLAFSNAGAAVRGSVEAA